MAFEGLTGGIIGGTGVTIVISAIDKFSKTFKSADKQLSGLTGTIQKNQQLLFGAGAALTGVGIAGAFALKGMVGDAMSFESAFIGVRKTVDLTEKEFELLENRFKSLSTEIPITFEELSSIGEIAGQLGVTGVNDLEKFTKVIADIAATTNLTTEAAATDFARFANIMGMSLGEIDKMGAAIVELGNNFATTESEILEMSLRLAGAGKVVGMTETDVLGFATALSAVGIEAQMGGSAISRTMIKISDAVASSGEELNVFAKTAGLSAEEFAEKWKTDAAGALVVLVNGLKEVIDSGGNVFGVLEDLGVQSIRERDALLRLAGAGDLVSRSLKTGAKGWKKNIALQKEAEKRYKSMESQIKILTNKFKLLSADLGEELFPILEEIIDVVSSMIDWFSDLSGGTKKLIMYVGFATTAFALFTGPLLILVSMVPSIVTGFGLIQGVIFGVGTTSATASVGTGALAATIMGPLGIAAGFAALVAIPLAGYVSGLGEASEAYRTMGGILDDTELGTKIRDLTDDIRYMESGTRMTEVIIPGLEGMAIEFGEVATNVSAANESIVEFIRLTQRREDVPGVEDGIVTNLEEYKEYLRELDKPVPGGTGLEQFFGFQLPTWLGGSKKETEKVEQAMTEWSNTTFTIVGPKITGVIRGISNDIGDESNKSSMITNWTSMGTEAIDQINDINKSLDSIPTDVYTTVHINTSRSNFGVPSFQTGGVMPYTGLAQLHKGETIVPANNANKNVGGITFIVEGDLIGLDAEDISRSLSNELNNKMSL